MFDTRGFCFIHVSMQVITSGNILAPPVPAILNLILLAVTPSAACRPDRAAMAVAAAPTGPAPTTGPPSGSRRPSPASWYSRARGRAVRPAETPFRAPTPPPPGRHPGLAQHVGPAPLPGGTPVVSGVPAARRGPATVRRDAAHHHRPAGARQRGAHGRGVTPVAVRAQPSLCRNPYVISSALGSGAPPSDLAIPHLPACRRRRRRTSRTPRARGVRPVTACRRARCPCAPASAFCSLPDPFSNPSFSALQEWS